MRVFTKAVSVWNGERYVLDEAASSWFEYAGPVAECKGASQEQRDLEKQQAAFTTTLTQAYSTQFANQNAILQSLHDTYDPILKAGPSQRGFSEAETSALRTQATEGTGAEYQKALKATREGLAARGGGNEFLPSGSADQLEAEIAAAAAGDQSSKNLAITQADYAAGRQNFAAATAALSGTAGMYNPTGYISGVNTSGNQAFGDATKIQELDNASSPWGAIGGILGGAASSFLNPLAAGGAKSLLGGGAKPLPYGGEPF